uniref:Protein TIC 214 n=1 Tax=Ochradenus baccatus TaxID=264972 RepID=A0A7M3ULV6_9ROSI|nr:Ycf1 [Ochradenus baccatus]QOI12876.1 Ycf1 [Ochradenus baccatus]
MVFKSFILGNLVSLCMKIINSVIVVGLYYGFLTTFSIGPSYLFLLRAQVMDEGEEGTEKKVSATTGFIAGQLMMFISIYYAPMHLALGRPHTITVLALPYLLFHFFWNNHNHFFDYGSTTRNSMRNLRIQCVFLNNLIFQLFNHFILPSSMLARLVNIYMFRCNNKMLFVTSSFVGWLIGHILFMKWVGLVLVWIQQNNSIRSNVLIRYNKYKFLVSELKNSMARIFSILLFITCVYYLGRIPAPIFTKKLKGTSETEERGGTKQDQGVSTEEDPFPSLFSEEREDLDKIDEMEEIKMNGKEKINKDDKFQVRTYYKTVYENLDGNQENANLEIFKLKKTEDKEKFLLWFEKSLITLLFNYKDWKRPNRYIKNSKFENTVRNEMSQYFFYTCQSDGKERISFTYPPSLSSFFQMIQKKISSVPREKQCSEEFSTYWSLTNEQKKKIFKTKLKNRIDALDKGSPLMNMLDKKTRFCQNEIKKEYLPKFYDPFLNGILRGQIFKLQSSSIRMKKYIKQNIKGFWINKIHSFLLNLNKKDSEFEENIDTFNRKSFSIKQKLPFFSKHRREKVNLEEKLTLLKLLIDVVLTDPNEQLILTNFIGIKKKEIYKKVPRWSYKLIKDLDLLKGLNTETILADPEIRSRKAKRVIIFTDNQANYTNAKGRKIYDPRDEVAFIRYSEHSDFRREIIKGSMRPKRCKTVIWEFFQANVHSPLFLDRINKPFFFSFDLSKLMKFFFRNFMWKNEKKNKIEKNNEEKKAKYKREEKARIEIAETWDNLLFAQALRGCVLIIQSILRKYIVLPLLIILKNFLRILLFQIPEWSEDFKDWKREMHIKCTYNGVQLSETEFPKNWLTDGIQIKIIFPFCLQPWHRSKLEPSPKDPRKQKKEKKSKNDFCFLTVWGMETKIPFGSPRKHPSFFKPILKELKKKIIKTKNKCFRILRVLKERFKTFGKVSKETRNWVIKRLQVLKKKKKELSKINPITLFGMRAKDRLSETQKNSTTSNQIIHESYIQNRSMECKNDSLPEIKLKDLVDRTKTRKNQIEKIRKEKENRFIIKEIKKTYNKISYHAKILESSKKEIQILKRKNARLIRKLDSFLKFFMEKIYIGIFLCIINIPIKTTQLFRESIQKISDKYIYNNQIKKNIYNIYFLLTPKTLLSNSRNNKSKIYCDLSSFSQAYVFFKLSQIQVNHLYKLKNVLQYKGSGISFFVNNEIKDFFDEQGIFHYEFKEKTFFNCEINEWKNWLKSHYQYNLPQITAAKFVGENYRNRLNQDFILKKKNVKEWDLYEKDTFFNYEKKTDFDSDFLWNQKHNFKKDYIYNLFSYKFSYKSSNSNYKEKFFDIPIGIPSNNYLVSNVLEKYGIEKIPDRKYLHWRILPFCLMNAKKLSSCIGNTKLWLFTEFVLRSNAYKNKPWIIPIKLLLFDFNQNENIYKNITRKKNDYLSSNENQFLRFSNLNQEENEFAGQGALESDELNERNLAYILANQEKNIEKNYAESHIKKHRNEKKSKSNTQAELNFFITKYLRLQLRWDYSLNKKIINNIKIYCLLLRLINPTKILISSIQRSELNLEILMIQRDLALTELMTKRILIIEPVRFSGKKNGKFLTYQTIGISLIHKTKHQINQRYKKKNYVDKKKIDESIAKHQKITDNRDKNHYNFFVPENILSPKRRREFRIVISFNSNNRNNKQKNLLFYNNKKNSGEFLNKNKDLDRDKNKLMKLKLFLWPNFRLEDLACMNRYWFNTNNGSRFSIVRIHMYPRFQIR